MNSFISLFFFFNDTATTEIHTLSLHDALPISYRVKASGTGEHACKGTREARISVATAAQTAKASEKTAARPKCPRGWTLVPDSFKGERYTCRADPPAQALKCGGGTKYFSETGTIGCR